ncbi:MAG: hypothetical protein JRI25_13860 [Deltaproteobacteria bacterium]|nr:hypothetical protein [Deltaproteobacteria bacterium]
MRTRIRMALAVGTVGLVGGVALAATVLNPPGSRVWMGICGIVAAAFALQAVSSEPRDLVPALLLAFVPVVGLASEGAPSWLGPPLAGLLLLAGELSALTWEGPVRMSEDGFLSTRLQEAGLVAALGLGVAVLLGAIGRIGPLGGTWAVVAGTAGLVGIAFVVFPRPSSRPGGRGGAASD